MASSNDERLERDLEAAFAVPVPVLAFEAPGGRPAPHRGSGRLRVAAVAGVAAVALVGAVLAAPAFLGGGTKTASAEELIQLAQDAAQRAAETNQTTFYKVTRAQTDHGGRGTSIREWRQWGDGPDRWRVEVHVGNGTGPLTLESVRAADGITLFGFEAKSGEFTTEPYVAATWRVYGSDGGLGVAADGANLDAVLEARRGCFTPTLAGKETVAGREAHVIDLGANHCVEQSAILSGAPGGRPVYLMMPIRLWIDSETFSVVKESKVGGPGDALQTTTTVISYERGQPVDSDLFVVDPRSPVR